MAASCSSHIDFLAVDVCDLNISVYMGKKKLNDSKRVILVPERAFLVWPDIQYLMPPQRPFDHCAGDNDFSTLLVSGVDIELGKVHDESFD